MKPSHFIPTLALALFPAFLSASTEITSHVISGGGGTASAGSVELHGTLGQPVAGVSATDSSVLSAGFWNITLEVVVDPESFQNWMDNLPPGDQPPVGQRGPQDTPAGDGVANLLKYAFGLLPMVPAADAQPKLVGVGGNLSLEFSRNPGANVSYLLQGSDDLEDWTEVTIDSENTAPLPEEREFVQMVTDHPVASEDRYFLRLRVSEP